MGKVLLWQSRQGLHHFQLVLGVVGAVTDADHVVARPDAVMGAAVFPGLVAQYPIDGGKAVLPPDGHAGLLIKGLSQTVAYFVPHALVAGRQPVAAAQVGEHLPQSTVRSPQQVAAPEGADPAGMKTPGDPPAQRQIPLGQVMVMHHIKGAVFRQIAGVEGNAGPHAHTGDMADHRQAVRVAVNGHAMLPVVIIELAFVPPDGEYDDLISRGQQQVFHRPLRPQRVAVGNQQNFRH